MAEGWLRHAYAHRFDAYSAGTEASLVTPLAIRAMSNVGVDISGQESKTLDRYLRQPWDYVITVCDQVQQVCPVFPGGQHRLHWSIPDPSLVAGTEAEQLEAYELVRDDLQERIEEFASALAD